MIRGNIRGKFISFVLCVVMVGALAGCGKQDVDQTAATDNKEYVYVPEFISLSGDEETTYYSNLTLRGNTLYYSQNHYDEATMTSTETIKTYSLEDGTASTVPLQMPENGYMSGFAPAGDGNYYVLTNDYSGEKLSPEGYTIPDVYLYKYDSQGAVVMEQNITDAISKVSEEPYVQGIQVDEQGRIYIIVEGAVVLLKEDGTEQGAVTIDGWINSIGLGKDGKVYFAYFDYASGSGGYVLSEIDFDGKKIGNTYKNLPNANGNGLAQGVSKDFLINDGSGLYEYELATQTYEKVVSWLDCDINGSYVNYVGAAENGTIIAVVNDWNTGITELVKLNKTEASQVVEKEEIVIGVLYEDQQLQASAVAFNKASDKYRVTIKTYIDSNNWTETSMADGIANLNNDITSATNCPDILDLSQLNAEQLVAKGALEDLTPYLEKSTVFDKEDFFENIVNGLTYDGTLVALPATFQINTAVGKTSLVGEEMGWSLDDMIALAKEHPDSDLFDGIDQTTMMYYCMMFNQDVFVDWSAGECHFDSDEFKALVEFVGMFPAEIDWTTYDGGAKLEEKQSGQLLLDTVYIQDFQEVQMYSAMFGEDVTFIGFPTTDGSVGSMMSVGSLYGITSKSDVKDGAWAFIESYLQESVDSMFSWGFPSLKEEFNKNKEEVMKVEYLLDENGEQILDENGDPMTTSGTSSVGWGDWEYTYHIPTAEEVAMVEAIISVSQPIQGNANDEIMTIINEEAEAYFSGQKSIDEVVTIIQSRAQIYISENS